AKPRASSAWSRGRLRPGIGTRIDLPETPGASVLNATSASGSRESARDATVKACLNRSSWDSFATRAAIRMQAGRNQPGCACGSVPRQIAAKQSHPPKFAGWVALTVPIARLEHLVAKEHRLAIHPFDRGYNAIDT